MKKIYLSIALAATISVGLNAQNKMIAPLSEDESAALLLPKKAITYTSPQLKGSNPFVSPQGCDTLGTTLVGGNGQNGNMFDITNTSTVAIQITGFAQSFQTMNAQTYEIYWRNGTFVGNEAAIGNWTLAASVPVTPSATMMAVPIMTLINVNMPAGSTFGWYCTSTADVVFYTNGTNQGGVLKQKNGVQVKEGRGIVYPCAGSFGTAPASRMWNGVVSYCSPLVTGVQGIEINETETMVYPNPSSNNVNVNISTSVGINNATANIYDMAGRLVYSQANINTNNFTVNHNLNSGLYVIQVSNDSKVVLNKKISVN